MLMDDALTVSSRCQVMPVIKRHRTILQRAGPGPKADARAWALVRGV